MGEEGPGIIELDHYYLSRAADIGAGEVAKRRAARRYDISGKFRLAMGVFVIKPVGAVFYGLYQRRPLGRAARVISYHAGAGALPYGILHGEVYVKHYAQVYQAKKKYKNYGHNQRKLYDGLALSSS